MMRGRRSWGTQHLDTTTSGELHAQWDPEKLALYLEPATNMDIFLFYTSCVNKVDPIIVKRGDFLSWLS